MKNPLHTPFAAIFQNELILNSRRVAPYALMILFAANAVLWWGWSAAATYGWAINSDYNIVRNLGGFMLAWGLPLFNALIMGDPVIRDFKTGIDSLIFSKPVSRATYLLAKFSANFFVLVCCMSVFMLTSLASQWFPTTRLAVLPVRVLPYFKHFFLLVVVSQLLLAAVFFTLATLKRNAKFAYGAAVAFYPLLIAYGLFVLSKLPLSWRGVVDPLMFSAFQLPVDKFRDPKWVNEFVVTYSPAMLANRAVLFGIAGILLAILCRRFSYTEPERGENIAVLNLSSAGSIAGIDPEFVPSPLSVAITGVDAEAPARRIVQLPDVAVENKGATANLRKIIGAAVLELKLLRHERSLMALVPLSILISFLALPFSIVVPGASPSAAFAGSSVRGLLLFLSGVIVFYLGEAMHRDREIRIEPVLWSTPASNSVFLLSKFFAVLFVALVLLVLAAFTAILTQFLRGQSPIEVSKYFIAYTVILVPSLAFVAAASLWLTILLRDKYLFYAAMIAIGSGLFYLYSQGFNHWLYNPVLQGLWMDSDLGSWTRLLHIMGLRVYWLAITGLCLILAHLFFARKSKREWITGSRHPARSS